MTAANGPATISQADKSASHIFLARFHPGFGPGFSQSFGRITYTEAAVTCQKSGLTARRYLDILAGAYMVRVLPPWFENVRKRQVKAPKIYIRDIGIFHALLQLETLSDLQGHPMLGFSWESFALEHVVGVFNNRDMYFWATHAGAELDLLVMSKGKRYGFEFKYADAPGTTRSMRTAINDLSLQHLWVAYPGKEEYDLDDTISVIPVSGISKLSVL